MKNICEPGEGFIGKKYKKFPQEAQAILVN